MANIDVVTLSGLEPTGTIGPDKLIGLGIATQRQIDDVCDIVVQEDRAWKTIKNSDVGDCYDGRPPEDESILMEYAKAAGGFQTAVVGLALIGERVDDETCSSQTARLGEDYVEKGHHIGGHTGDVHGDPAVDCGCGACDKLQPGLAYIADPKHTAALRDTIQMLGVTVAGEVINRIIANAAPLAETGYADGGRNIVDAIKAQGGEACVPKLGGEHQEAVVVINRIRGETLDRVALRQTLAERGLPNVQAFCLDLWAIRETARNLAPSPNRIEEYVAAMLMHNLAIAAVLCDPSLRVAVR